MGLDTSFDCWHGPYSAFHNWRTAVAQAAGLPPLEMMAGFLPTESEVLSHGVVMMTEPAIKWESLPPSPLLLLLNHSDCDGSLRWEDCGAIADCLEELLPRLNDDGKWSHAACARQFIKGLRAAEKAQENVEFH